MCICELGENTENKTESQIKTSRKGAEFILDQINNVILKELVPHECVKYELFEIKKADFVTHDKVSIIIQTKLNDALFEADLIVKESGKFEIIENNIQRVSMYGKTASCVKSEMLKSYCYCVSNLKKGKNPK